ncbi:P-loop NTPase fold protein [Paenibacillus sp. HB172176]|uniref:KAP family P-loop NTPase fold protein n=1 Tax=Paenibacillus sp. HB172176 TaxID=2493690 RepID=UPI001438DDE6|nr:P-loop NTPase fold protein [Paenibacillus sp. HB172176]
MFGKYKNTDGELKKYFLEDRPLQKINDDKFQYNQVAEILFDLLKQNNFPTHIGLFGSWGSGKTSVIKLLERILEADKSYGGNFIIKTISVWKFADDAPSLHRKIVREVQTELEVPDEEGLINETTKIESITGKGLFAILFVNSKLYRWSTIGFLFIVMISIALSILLNDTTFTAYISTFISVSTIGLVLGALKLFIGSYQRGSQSSVRTIPLTHGDQYEARFKASVGRFLEKNRGRNLVLVFDDLDRLPPKQLLAALNTIKTFLHSKNCAFIIPCDEKVLRNGIKSAFEQKDILEDKDSNSDDKYVSEFINKTFDYQIHLPILEQKNMKRYARQLLIDQKIDWINDQEINIDKVLGILIYSSIKTPRQVKALLNSFSSNWQLAKKRDNSSGKKLLSSNPLAVAVFTVLQTDFPEYYLKLISDPYLIIRNDSRTDVLNAFLTRVNKCIPKDDPRPFIYFSNEKLNPITGKPELKKIKEYLINAQLDLFVAAYEKLNDLDRGILLSSVIADFDDDPGIEVENCIKTLIESQTNLDVISDMDINNWDLLLRDNMDTLLEFPPSKVCGILKHLTYDSSTWVEYGMKINVLEHSGDILLLWIEKPDYINKLAISNLGGEIEDAYIENNDGYSLAAFIFEVSSEHSIMNSFDWIKILKESLDTNVVPEYTLSNWLREWSNKTHKSIDVSLINELLKTYDFESDSFVECIGQLWCERYTRNEEDLVNLIHIMEHENFCGFTENDFDNINSFISEAPYKRIHDVVRPILDKWWEDKRYEKAVNFINTFSKSPGTPGFCEKNFNFDLDDSTQNVFLDTIVNRAKNLSNGIPNITEVLKSENNSSATEHRNSRTPEVINTLLQSKKLKEALISIKEEFMQITDNVIWLNWSEQVVRDRLEIVFLLWGEDETAKAWLFDSINYLVNVSKNIIHSRRPYSSNASRYINIFVQFMCNKYKEENWDQILTNWVSIPTHNNTSLKIDLFAILDSTARAEIIGHLNHRCTVGCDAYNTLMVQYFDPSLSSHREAISTRWEVISSENRKMKIEEFSSNNENGEQEKVIKLILNQIERNPLTIYLDELINWSIRDNLRKTFTYTLLSNLPYNTVAEWVNNAMDSMNKEGFNKWRSQIIEAAISQKKINIRDYENIYRVALGLGKERAKLALQLLLATNLTKIETRKFRDAIIDLDNDYPDYVNQFGFRFKRRK